jgi:anti-sigma regulatory factor (Ser/Thr protein kinase)
MKELSLHILDIVQNSISAGAKAITITVCEDISENILLISVKDNGQGMDKETAEKIKDPFFTSRTTRKVGLGVPLLCAAAKRCGGDLWIKTEQYKGTEVTAEFLYNHIDRAPLGNMWDTISDIILCNEDIDFNYTHIYDKKIFEFKTVDMKNVLNGVPVSSPEVIDWIRGYLREGINSLYGGVDNENNPGFGGN